MKLSQADIMRLIDKALEMRNMSYVPYSGYAVGAGLLCADGTLYGGCNIENASFSPTVCAERTAIFKAVSEGKKEFTAIAIAGGKAGSEPDPECPPCGVCRQVMAEFCSGDFVVILAQSRENYQVFSLRDLMPMVFNNL